MTSRAEHLANQWRAMEAARTGCSIPEVPAHLQTIAINTDAALMQAWTRARQGRTLQPSSVEAQPRWSR